MTYATVFQFFIRRILLAAVGVGLLFLGTLAAKELTSVAKKGIASQVPDGVRAVKIADGYMVPFVETIPGTNTSFEMIPVPGGDFLIGSPADEPGRNRDEGPQVRVKIEPFWIGKCEVTWAEYKSYMAMHDAFGKMEHVSTSAPLSSSNRQVDKNLQLIRAHAWNSKLEINWNVDAVTCPTPIYEPSFTYGAGDKPNQPAVTMSQFAARQYTKWLSGILVDNYRLPTEAEWEYAARAGTTTPWSFGSDTKELDKYAWTDANSEDRTHAVGTKLANPWGLYDMHGNVAEWTLDEYAADKYAKLGAGPVAAMSAVQWPTKLFPRVIRGGSWLEPAALSRSAARQKSNDWEWLASDADIPKSPWWFTEEAATAVGMRIIRPLQSLTAEEKKHAWEPDIDTMRDDVRDSVREGRGRIGVTDRTLPEAVKAAEKLDERP